MILFSGGICLLRAVFAAEPYLAKGFEGILAALLRLPYGNWLLGFVALGLAAYGFSWSMREFTGGTLLIHCSL